MLFKARYSYRDADNSGDYVEGLYDAESLEDATNRIGTHSLRNGYRGYLAIKDITGRGSVILNLERLVSIHVSEFTWGDPSKKDDSLINPLPRILINVTGEEGETT